MPKTKRRGAIYQRGQFRLDWDRRADGSLRSPNLAIFWYDAERGGNRTASAGTADIEEGKTALDAFFLEQTTGEAHCPTCGQPRNRAAGFPVSDAIASYLIGHARRLESYGAISARLDHVLDYLDHLPNSAVSCDAVDEPWIARFREWAERRPIISPKGEKRPRSPSTIEASVAQLSAAINFSYGRGDAPGPARFKAIAMRGLNQTPQHRSSIAELAAMMRYCISPDVSAELGRKWGRRKEPYSEAELIEIRRRERAALHRFLIISIATLARPDAAHDFSLDPKRKQWIPDATIANLNPKGRRQTKKYRATVPIAWQVVPLLSASPKDYFVGPKSIRQAWGGMAAAIDLPGDREGGEKLIRRSMADLIRRRLPQEAVPELSMFMGHDRVDPVTSLYAPFSPDYLRRALSAIEAIIDEIEGLCPGAFSRTLAGNAAELYILPGRKNA